MLWNSGGALAFCSPVHSSLLWSNFNCNSVLFPKWPRKRLEQVQTAACHRHSQDAELPAVFPQVCRLPASWSAWSCTWLHSARRPDTPHHHTPLPGFHGERFYCLDSNHSCPSRSQPGQSLRRGDKAVRLYKARLEANSVSEIMALPVSQQEWAAGGSAGATNLPRCSLAGWGAWLQAARNHNKNQFLTRENPVFLLLSEWTGDREISKGRKPRV